MIDQLKADLKRQEGIRYAVYTCPAGFQTIGCGRNLDTNPLSEAESETLGCSTLDLLAGQAISAQDVDHLLGNDVAKVCAALDQRTSWWRTLSESAQRGLADMAFQMGVSGVMKFQNMLSCLEIGDYAGAKVAALDSAWARQTPNRAAEVTALFQP